MHSQRHVVLSLPILCILGLAVLGMSTPASANWQAKVQPAVLDDPAPDASGFFVLLAEQADLTGAIGKTKREKGEFVYRSLTRVADRTQPDVVRELESLGAPYERYWIANAIWVQAGLELVERMARRADVSRIVQNSRLKIPDHRSETAAPPDASRGLRSYGWNIDKMEAWRVWDVGHTGQGVVVGTIDSGVIWDLPELINQYRGWDGATADHNYTWHDAIHSGNSTLCPPDSPAPCSNDHHGTMVVGLAVGDDGLGNQIGVAPGAEWITCRGFGADSSSVATVAECVQWMLAPTDLNDEFPDPSKAPDVLNNSWLCYSGSGCTDQLVFELIFDNLRAAGVVSVGAAGNDGPDCDTVLYAPAIYQSVLAVGSSKMGFTGNEVISSFSSQGPAAVTGLVKPDVVAPGEGVLSVGRTGGTLLGSATSFSSPHVAGEVALLISAFPALAGNVDSLGAMVKGGAEPRTSAQECGGVPDDQVPNNRWGWGRVNAWRSLNLGAVSTPTVTHPAQSGLALSSPNPFVMETTIEYSISDPAPVSLVVHDVAGRRVRMLMNVGEHRTGVHHVVWDGRNGAGQAVAPGIYFVRLKAGSSFATRKLVRAP